MPTCHHFFSTSTVLVYQEKPDIPSASQSLEKKPAAKGIFEELPIPGDWKAVSYEQFRGMYPNQSFPSEVRSYVDSIIKPYPNARVMVTNCVSGKTDSGMRFSDATAEIVIPSGKQVLRQTLKVLRTYEQDKSITTATLTDDSGKLLNECQDIFDYPKPYSKMIQSPIGMMVLGIQASPKLIKALHEASKKVVADRLREALGK